MAMITEDEINSILDDPKKRMMTAVILAGDFELFIKYTHFAVNKVNFAFKPFHITLIKKLEDIAFNKNEKRNLGISIPVGAGKSLIVEYFIAWTFCRNINLAYLYTSHNRTNIMKLSREVKDIIQHPFLKVLFGLKLKDDEASKINWSFEGAINRTGLVATTTGSGSTGADSGNPGVPGYSGAVIVDDILDAGNANNKIAKDECIKFYDEKLATRRRTPTTPSIVIMQRLHVEDLIGWLKKNQPDEWDFVEIPAINEDGDSFWPERYPLSELESIKRINPSKFYAQYQQSPLEVDDRAIYKRDSFNWYDELPQFDQIIQSWDTAFKIGTQNDYSVGSTWGIKKVEFGANYYLINLWRGKVEYPQLKAKFIELMNKYSPAYSLIEDKASGQSLIQDLRQSGNNRLKPIKADSDKVSRSVIPSSLIENGCVFLPRQASWLSDFLDEVLIFPNAEHDDCVDSMNQFLNWAEKPRIKTIGFNL